jgi:hypothetical protein
MLSKRVGTYILLGVTLALIIAYPIIPRFLRHDHHFADHRGWLGVANFGDVASNLLFALFGTWGLLFLASKSSHAKFLEQRERWPYWFIFLGMLWTAFGSGYYHLAPSNARLVWDRLPMTVVFMPLVAAMIMQWNQSELRGAGDLRFYGAVRAILGTRRFDFIFCALPLHEELGHCLGNRVLCVG